MLVARHSWYKMDVGSWILYNILTGLWHCYIFVKLLRTAPGGYSHIMAVWVCATRKAPLLKTPPFRPGLLRKTPFPNIYICLFHFSDLGCSKRPLLKNVRFFVIFSSKIPPHISMTDRSESPPFSVRGRSLSFLHWAAHIYLYTYLPPSYMSTPPGLPPTTTANTHPRAYSCTASTMLCMQLHCRVNFVECMYSSNSLNTIYFISIIQKYNL